MHASHSFDKAHLSLGSFGRSGVRSTSRGARRSLDGLLVRVGDLSTLQIGQTSGLGVDVAHLLVGLDVEVANLTASRGAERLLKVGVETLPAAGGLVGDLVALIESLGTLCSLVLLVEVGQGSGEAVGDAVLLVQGDGLLDRLVADYIAMCKVFGNDSRAWLVLLVQLVVVLVLGVTGAGGLGTSNVVEAVGCSDVYSRRTKLSVVEEKSSLSSTVSRRVSIRVIELRTAAASSLA